ncbi:MAG: TonB-dependent receptor [Bacteroidales bacterium]|nr:TonB-dependent receptor [Bacteroidales bacterium]
MKKLLFSIFILLLTLFSVNNLSAQQRDTLQAEDILKMSITDLMNAKVITASKMSQSIRDVAANVRIITAEQIRTRGYFTLEEALSDLPGFQFRNILGYNSYVFMRGAPSQNNLILLLVDGIQINEINSGGFYAGGQFILSDVETIEVVYGPASAMYGTNAVSGIINIITKKVQKADKGHISLLGGTFNTAMTDFSVRDYSVEKKMGFSVSGMYKTTEKADLRGKAGDNNWSSLMENFEKDLSFSAKFQYKRLTAGVVYQDKRASRSTSYNTFMTDLLDRNTSWNISLLNSYIKYKQEYGSKFTLNASGYFRDATIRPSTVGDIRKATLDYPGSQVRYYRPNSLVGAEVHLDYKPFDRMIISGGLIGEAEKVAEKFSLSYSNSQYTEAKTPTRPKMLSNELFSFYLQANVNISNNLSLIAGLRKDFSSYYGEVLTPRTALVFNTEKLSAKLMYNRAFRAPKPWDYTYGLGNSDLKPEKMESVELSMTYKLSNNFSAGLSVYRNFINEKLTKEIIGTNERWINEDELLTKGVELYGNYVFGKLFFTGNYTYNGSTDQNGVQTPEISPHVANLGMTYNYDHHIRINLRANYTGKRLNHHIIPNTGNRDIKAATVFNGCISYLNFHGFDIQFKVENIFNKEYYHSSNLPVSRFRQPQRGLKLSLTYHFDKVADKILK